MADRKRQLTVTMSEFYQDYRKNKNKELSQSAYKSLINDFFLIIGKKIIYENYIFRMPVSLGSIYAKAGKNKKTYYIDFQKTKEVGRPVKFLNRHTFGYYFMYYWDKGMIRFKNMNFYKFSPTKSNTSERKGVGTRVFGKHIKAKSEDPNQTGYVRV